MLCANQTGFVPVEMVTESCYCDDGSLCHEHQPPHGRLTAVVANVRYENRVKYIEEELRKRRGLVNPDGTTGDAEKSEMEQLEESLYQIPDNLKQGTVTREGGTRDRRVAPGQPAHCVDITYVHSASSTSRVGVTRRKRERLSRRRRLMW
eukprot:485188-Prorocentrum_minimum.AAC.3